MNTIELDQLLDYLKSERRDTILKIGSQANPPTGEEVRALAMLQLAILAVRDEIDDQQARD